MREVGSVGGEDFGSGGDEGAGSSDLEVAEEALREMQRCQRGRDKLLGKGEQNEKLERTWKAFQLQEWLAIADSEKRAAGEFSPPYWIESPPPAGTGTTRKGTDAL